MTTDLATIYQKKVPPVVTETFFPTVRSEFDGTFLQAKGRQEVATLSSLDVSKVLISEL